MAYYVLNVIPQDCFLNHKIIEMFGHPEILFCVQCENAMDIRKVKP